MKVLKLSFMAFIILMSFATTAVTIAEAIKANNRAGLISNRVEITIDNNAYNVWDIFMEDKTPQTIFKRVGLVGGVKSVVVVRGRWNQVGAQRVVYLDDSTNLRETITENEMDQFFEYKITDISNIIGDGAEYAKGQWWFKPTADGKTKVTWIYSFKPKGFVSRGVLTVVLNTAFDSYMRNTILNFKKLAE